jgi:hypothetical protein
MEPVLRRAVRRPFAYVVAVDGQDARCTDVTNRYATRPGLTQKLRLPGQHVGWWQELLLSTGSHRKSGNQTNWNHSPSSSSSSSSSSVLLYTPSSSSSSSSLDAYTNSIGSSSHGGHSSSSRKEARRQHQAAQHEQDELEEAAVRNLLPLPQSLAEFKDHPIYRLQRHLRADEAVNPLPGKGKVVGVFRGENVYLKSQVRYLFYFFNQ